MKNLLKFTAALLFAFSVVTVNAQSNDNSLIGKARGAAHECLTPYLNSHDVDAFADVTGICIAGGFLHRVTFTAGPKCPPNQVCPLFPTVIIATVDFDCEGNIIAVNCSTP
jgi:hypothetical protein